MNILEALDDSVLFGAAFTGPSWVAWRPFLARDHDLGRRVGWTYAGVRLAQLPG